MNGQGHGWVRNAPAEPEQARAELARLEIDKLGRLVHAHFEMAFMLVVEAVRTGRLVLRVAPPEQG